MADISKEIRMTFRSNRLASGPLRLRIESRTGSTARVARVEPPACEIRNHVVLLSFQWKLYDAYWYTKTLEIIATGLKKYKV